MCTDKILFCPSNTDVRQIERSKKAQRMSYEEVSKLVDALRYVANSHEISIAEATERLREQNAFPHIYHQVSAMPTISARRLANMIRKHLIA